MISVSHSCPNPLQGVSFVLKGREEDDKRDLMEDNERVLQMFTGSWSYVWGAAWRKHKGACVTTSASGWQSWHLSQQHGAWSWYHKGYLRGWPNSDKIILLKRKIWDISNMHHLCHILLQPYFHPCSCCWQFIRMPLLCCELTYCFSVNAISLPLLFLEIRCKNSLQTSTICFGGSQISLHNPAYQ